MYHYTRSGLDNVWLENGYRAEDLGDYGQSVVIENVVRLERAIARHLVEIRRPLTGQEFRFLRVMLDLSQTAVGRRLGKDYQTVARWEAAGRKPVPRFADVAIRARYLESIGERPMFTQIEDRLAELAASATNGGATFLAAADGSWQEKNTQPLQAAQYISGGVARRGRGQTGSPRRRTRARRSVGDDAAAQSRQRAHDARPPGRRSCCGPGDMLRIRPTAPQAHWPQPRAEG